MKLDNYIITLDVDWASDGVIRSCAQVLIEHNVKATWLITHDSETVAELAQRSDLFELGIHPNFHADGTQGNTPETVLEHLLAIVPGARSVRTHDLFQSTRLLRMMVGHYGIENDLSLLLPDTANITPHEFHLPEGVLRRFPTFWEDDAEMLRPRPSFTLANRKYHVPGLKIFSFHPILVALNAASLDAYRELKSKHRMSTLSPAKLEGWVNRTGEGNGTFFRELAAHISSGARGASLTVTELARKWLAMCEDG